MRCGADYADGQARAEGEPGDERDRRAQPSDLERAAADTDLALVHAPVPAAAVLAASAVGAEAGSLAMRRSDRPSATSASAQPPSSIHGTNSKAMRAVSSGARRSTSPSSKASAPNRASSPPPTSA